MTRKLIAFFYSFPLFAVNVLNSLYYFRKGYFIFKFSVFREKCIRPLCYSNQNSIFTFSQLFFICVQRVAGRPFQKSIFYDTSFGFSYFEICKKGGRAAGYLFENIAGNQSLQFDSNMKAHVEVLSNLAKQGWQRGGQWDGLVSSLRKKPFSAQLVLVIFLEFYLTQSIFILHNLLLLDSISSFL